MRRPVHYVGGLSGPAVAPPCVFNFGQQTNEREGRQIFDEFSTNEISQGGFKIKLNVAVVVVVVVEKKESS